MMFMMKNYKRKILVLHAWANLIFKELLIIGPDHEEFDFLQSPSIYIY